MKTVFKATRDVPLGALVKDRVSGFTGICECVSFWLNGCVRVTIAPNKLTKEGSVFGSYCVDIEQVEVLDPNALAPKPAERRTNGPMPDAVRY